MKRMIVGIIVLSILFWVGCKIVSVAGVSIKQKDNHTTENGIPSAGSTLTRTYSLVELQEYFGIVSPNEGQVYGTMQDSTRLKKSAINEKFPIEYTREISTVVSYSVFKVDEGGYYYVFWSSNYPVVKQAVIESSEARGEVLFTVYFESLPQLNDFNMLEIGMSTAEDVSRISSAFELSFAMSVGPQSFSLLNDGSVLHIMYERNTNTKSREDLLIRQIRIMSKEDAQSVSYLASIIRDDLPSDLCTGSDC